jgi:membrane-bound metal-dependent hydrolase YbcI (DUF457 family)
MFIGHFAIAFLLARLFPQVTVLIPLVAVSFPDLLWPLLVFAGIEKVKVNPESALQKHLVFESYPYSHSLIFTNFVALAVGLVLEFIFYAVVTIAVLPGRLVSGALLLGIVFHLINANSFFGFTRKNPFRTPASYALITLIGFGLFIFFASKIRRELK